MAQFNKTHIFKKLSIYSVFILMLLSLSCSSNNEVIENAGVEVVDIEASIDNFSIVKLSDYASDIRYIPLETSDSILIGGISKVIYERETIYILDFSGKIHLFDKRGRHQKSFFRKGRGPGEYTDAFSLNVNPDNGDIFIVDVWRGILRYDNNFNFIKMYSFPGKGTASPGVEIIGEELIAVSLASFIDFGYSIICYGQDTSDIVYKKEAILTHDPTKRDVLRFLYYSMYKLGDQLRYYNSSKDSVFSLSQDFQDRALYYISLGKFKEPENISTEDYGSSEPKIITPLTYFESDRLLFMSFILRGLCREPIEMKGIKQDGTESVSYSTADYSIYDKQKKVVKFLLHPEKDMHGMEEDILGGKPFWPNFVNSNKDFVSYEHALDLINYFEKYPPKTKELKELSATLKEDSNPVFIIATSK